MKKLFSVFLICLTVTACLPETEAKSDRIKETSANFSEKDKRPLGVDSVVTHTFSDCCSQYEKIVKGEISNIEDNTQFLFIEHDVNDDEKMDFLVLIENPEVCILGKASSGCPIHLFIQNFDKTYKHYEGPREKGKKPMIRGREVGISQNKTNGIKDLFFYSPFMDECYWKWSAQNEKDQGSCTFFTKSVRPDQF